MVETCHLHPPVSGPQSDPLLFGVAEALARLFPVEGRPEPTDGEPLAPAPERVDDEGAPEALAA